MALADTDELFDVAVVGAGPAGSTAALTVAEAGARTVIIDRAVFPRYKTCGGGLIGLTLGALPRHLHPPVETEIFDATFTLRGGRRTSRSSDTRILALVDRAEFDHALLERALAAGATARLGTTVTAIEQIRGHVELTTSAGPIRANRVIGADGSASRVARYVGATFDRVDLGLEVELDATDVTGWERRVHLDWGPIPGSYGWVFPKRKTLTVGVIAQRGSDGIREYLQSFLRRQGLSDLPVVKSSGHLTRCRSADSPLGLGLVLLCGDAAGLLEPWTREGISFAVRSGYIAGLTAATPADFLQRQYAVRINSTLVPEMAAGFRLLRAFERHPALMHALLAQTPFGWTAFTRMARGETTLARALGRRPAAAAVRLLGI